MSEEPDLSTQMELIKRQPVFSQLTSDETKELASLFKKKMVKTGEVIVKEGELVDSIYLIANGTADVRHLVAKDNEQENLSVAILSINDSVGLDETGFYSISGKRTATVVALSDMVLYRLSVAAFHGFALSHSHVNDVMNKHAEMLLSENEKS